MSLPEQNVRGVKRRRPDDGESEEDKEAKLRRKLYHALKELRRVVKKTRTFEVQRTLKKLKEARRKDPRSDGTKDLEAQVETLKHLNYDRLAHSALVTKLRKDKALSADTSIQAILKGLASDLVSPGAPGTPVAKVQSRILSSKVLASEVVSTVETLRTLLHPSVGLEGIGDNFHASPKRSRTGIGHEKIAFSPNDSVANPCSEGSDREYENSSGDEAIVEDDGWESGTVGDDSASGSADDRDPGADDSNDPAPPKNPKGRTFRPHGSEGQSEFLPSLAVGFTRGSLDSDFSDSETGMADGIKKNRRGQRARRAIWEKKFGKNAKHIKEQRRQKTARGSMRHLPDSVRVDRRSEEGNSSSRAHRTPTQFRIPREQVRIQDSGPTRGQSELRVRRSDLRGRQGQPLHPSWDAKRKQKAASIVPSQGTKIVFSES